MDRMGSVEQDLASSNEGFYELAAQAVGLCESRALRGRVLRVQRERVAVVGAYTLSAVARASMAGADGRLVALLYLVAGVFLAAEERWGVKRG